MILNLPKKSLPEALQSALGVDGAWRGGQIQIDLSKFKPEIIDHIETALKTHGKDEETKKNVRGVTAALRSIDAYKRGLQIEPDKVCATTRSPAEYYAAWKRLIAQTPSKRVYRVPKDVKDDVTQAYYIASMSFSPRCRQKDSDGRWYTVLARIALHLEYMDDRGLQNHSISFDEDAFMRKQPHDVLKNVNYYMETPDLKADMLKERATWREWRSQIGLQLRGVGFGETQTRDDDDDNHRWRYHYSTTVNVKLDRDGPAPLVVDFDNEKNECHFDEEAVLKKFSTDFWTEGGKLTDDESKLIAVAEAKLRKKKSGDDDEKVADDDETYLDDEIDDEETDAKTPVREGGNQTDFGPLNELPVHPYLTCFDLRKHCRVRVHLSQLTKYEYDVTMRDKLVIDQASRMLIEMLLWERQTFKDVVAKKGGGAVILCAGPPGVGKTLTSEVFAESEKRPLYSVQCSQLGVTAEELEGNLLQIFARAQRWRAILLLDEADVYIAKRGNDMNQNAIVGVFLRVLEYYSGVMFMTTNRAESVDDAVLSRCVARIDYKNPEAAEQERIWAILAATSGLELAPGAAKAIASKFSLSGRDVKQLLKLSGLVARARGNGTPKPIDLQIVEYCMKFKPTEKTN